MGLDLDAFGEMMDDILEKNHVQMLIDMPEGTQEATVKDNLGLGPAVQFYILLQGFCETYRRFRDIIDPGKEGDFLDALLEVVKEELLGEEDQNGEM